MASAILPSIAGSFETKKKKDVRHKISVAIKTIMFIAIPSAVGMTVLSRPIVWLLYNTNTDSIRLGGCLLAALGASIVFYSLSTLSNSILQAVGKASKPVTNAVIALAVQTVVAAALLIFTDIGIYSLPIAVTVYSFMMCLLNGIAVKKATGYHQEIEKTFVLPLVSSAIMGLVVAGIYYGLTLTVLKGCTAAFGGNRRTDVFCGGVKAWRHVEKRTARNSRRQYDCEICGKIAFAEELGRKFVIEL